MPDVMIAVDLIEFENGIWRLDGSVDRGIAPSSLVVKLNGAAVPFRYTARYAQVNLQDQVLTDRNAFVLELSGTRLKKHNVIEFAVRDESGKETVLPVLAGNYQARVHSGLKHSYWCFRTAGDAPEEKLAMSRETAENAGSDRQPANNAPEEKLAMSRETAENAGSDRQPANNAPDERSAAKVVSAGKAAEYMVTLRRSGISADGAAQKQRPSDSGQDGAAAGEAEERRTECMADAIIIRRCGRADRLRQEFKFLWEMLSAPYGSRQMFAVRCLYWLAYPVYSRKNIWITFDKLYKGGDCGEYFYKYMAKNADGIFPAYVMKSGVPDYKRLVQEGYRPVVYRSLRQRLFYLYAEMVFGTHSGVNSFCGFNNWEIRFVQDRLRAVNTCIQHGLSVQDLRIDSNRAVNNNKRYYCASRYEIENLAKPEYDYAAETLRLTGIPRYDGLEDRGKKQILITPTWRSYIAMPSVMGESRKYNPEFKNTDYYRIYQSLLENKRLAEAARKAGYRIVYLLHPVISAQKEDFRPANGVDVLSALETDYEQILTQSGLMVTDYSGVQFDFAYMRKPVVYFHPQELPPHYGEGGFSYATQGFGEICRQEDELVELLCSYMDSECRLKEFYRARQDDFFAYDDRENCRRIYEDALQYQEKRRAGAGRRA